MVPKNILPEFLASCIIFLRRCLFLILYPYKTMRAIAEENDWTQIFIIFGIIAIYYGSLSWVKDMSHSPLLQLCLVLFNYTVTVLYIAFFGKSLGDDTELRKLLFVFAYALIPTIIWFYMNTFLYVVIPPPRNLTILGKSFSIVFITISTSLLAWKLILWYLAIRFATKLKFYDILYITILYIAIVVPYSLFMYHLGFFRIPFI
jgi:hypothetical protein